MSSNTTEGEPTGISARLSKALRRLVMREARVAACARLTDRFTLVTLEGTALREVTWSPGSKIQIAMPGPFTTRTYTPIDWDPVAGTTRILGYAHGSAPGSAWLTDLEPGDRCQFLGPRGSIDASRLQRPLVLFGDETSMGVACALAKHGSISAYFEVGDVERAQHVATQVGIENSTFFSRGADSLHVNEMEEALSRHCESAASFVLTGKAATIQRLRQRLKRHAIPSARLATKAYWAPGKIGLD